MARGKKSLKVCLSCLGKDANLASEDEHSDDRCPMRKIRSDDGDLRYLVLRLTTKAIRTVVRGLDDDEANGSMTFVLWINDSDSSWSGGSIEYADSSVHLYVALQSGFSSIWNKIRNIRDSKFPKLFARLFLDVRSLKNAELRSFFDGALTMSKISSYDILKKFCVVKSFKAALKSSERGDKLAEIAGIIKVTSNYVTVQFGQIKVPLDSYTDLLNMKDDRLPLLFSYLEKCLTNDAVDVHDRAWTILDHVEVVRNASIQKKVRETLLRDVQKYLQVGDTQTCFEVESFLSHMFQRDFDACKDVRLRWKRGDALQTLLWSDGTSHRIGRK